MDLIKEWDDLGFDLKRALDSASTYSNSTGVDTTIIDTQGSILFETNIHKSTCTYCRSHYESGEVTQCCSKALLYGSYQAERFGGQYIFFCPVGLVMWASPVIASREMKAAILGGPVLMLEPEVFLIDDIIRNNNNDEVFINRFMDLIKTLPVVQPDKVNSFANLLFIVSAHVSDIKPSQYFDEKEYYEQQSSISDYIQYIKTMGGEADEKESYPLDKEKELLSLISIGDKPGSQKVLNEILGYIFFSTGGNFEIIKSRILELVVLLSRAALEGGADIEQIFGLNYKYLSQINEFKTVDELAFWLSKIMARFTDCVFNLTEVKHVDVIYKAIDYIKRNYMKKITLEEVAAHTYLSPSYFSKVFKEEMKCNFNVYLNHIRVEYSKRLLLVESIPIIDVSNLVGFEDQSYFSKVFKKVAGMTPGKYRDTRGQRVKV